MRQLTAKGAAGTVFLTTDDVQASYEELKGRGVEFVDPPEQRPYGIDSSFRDPSGNHLRLMQVTALGVDLPAVRPEARLLVAVEQPREVVQRVERVEHVEDL